MTAPTRPRLVSILLAAGLGMTLAGCEPSDPKANAGLGPRRIERMIWADPETGCQYHFWEHSSGSAPSYSIALAPRLGRDGKPVCSPLPATQGGR